MKKREKKRQITLRISSIFGNMNHTNSLRRYKRRTEMKKKIIFIITKQTIKKEIKK